MPKHMQAYITAPCFISMMIDFDHKFFKETKAHVCLHDLVKL